MACERIRAQLTAYLDGGFGDGGTVVRGHLRTCSECARVAEQEAALRDGLRALPSVDPPSALWARVQAQLAVEEVAESQRPGWRRTLSRWRTGLARLWAPSRLAVGGLVVAAAVVVVYVKTRPSDEGGEGTQITLVDYGKIDIKAVHKDPPPAPNPADCLEGSSPDVTDDLASEPARIAACYSQAIDQLLAATQEMRANWNGDRRVAFDSKVQSMRTTIGKASEGKPRQRASQALYRYVEGATIREDVVLARSDR